MCENLLRFTLSLLHYLLSPNRDFSFAVDYVNNIIRKLKHKRLNSNKLFSMISHDAS